MKHSLLISGLVALLATSFTPPCMVGEAEMLDTIPSLRMKCDTAYPLDHGRYHDTVTDNMFTKWHRTEFVRICKKNKIPKISCAKCSSVFADVVFAVNETGKPGSVTIEKSRACGGELTAAMKKDIVASLLKLRFPKQCYNACFRKRVGRALKC